MDLPVRKKLRQTIPQWVAEGSWFFITIKCLPQGKNQLCQVDGAHGVTRPIQVAAAVGRLADKSKPNPPRARTNLCEQDSAGCNWFSHPVRDDRGGDDQKSRVANLRRAFRRHTSSSS